jgi:hypothetical protein
LAVTARAVSKKDTPRLHTYFAQLAADGITAWYEVRRRSAQSVEERLCCCLIDICHSELGEQLVRLFFFVERLPQKLAGILLIGPRDEGAITGDLVMLDSLRRSKHACVVLRQHL